MKKYAKFFSFLKRNTFLLFLCVTLNVVSGLSKSLGAVYLQDITDTLEAGGTDSLLSFVLIGGILTFSSYVLRWLGAVVPNFLSHKFAYETRIELFTHLSKIPFIDYEGDSQGELQSIIQNDSDKAGFIFYSALSRILNNIFLFIFSVWVMAATNIPATILAVAIVFAATAVNQRILRRMKKHETAAQQNLAEMTHSLESSFSGLETIKTARAGDYAVSSFTEKQKAYCENRLRSTKVDAMRTIWYTFIENLCLFGSIGYLGFLGISGEMSIGEVLMFIYLIKQIIMPIEVAFRWMVTITSSAASWERILKKYAVPAEQSPSSPPPADIGCLEARDITFAYNDKAPILQKQDVALQKGKLTGLSGSSGSGKTTLLKILSGVYRAESGSCTADGKLLTSLQGIAAYAALDNGLFPLSIYDNIALGDGGITRKAAETMLERLGFAEWLHSLPQGLDTMLNNDISGGQKQAITNARALLSGKPLLILDEPCSALDSEREEALNMVLQKMKGQKLILLTSHREDILAGCDKKINLS